MENYIIGAIVIILIAVGVLSTVKHFQGKSACCGGGRYRPRKKKLKKILYQKTFLVEGMHCARCSARVEEVVGDIHGISGRVDLKKGLLTVYYAEEVEDEVLGARIAKAGYSLRVAEEKHPL